MYLYLQDTEIQGCSVRKITGIEVPLHALKAYRGCGGMAPFVLILGIRWR
jgi:hypothetical protein